jgi:hypothetical protein
MRAEIVLVHRKRNTAQAYRTNYWSRNTQARCPLNLCITFICFMQHMYGHVGELKLLVPSFGRVVLAIVNADAEKN